MKNNKGFTLIEIVASLVILGIVAVPLLRFFTDSYKYQARGQEKTEATKVAQYIAEQLKSKNYFSPNADYLGPVPFSEIENGEPYLIGDFSNSEIPGLSSTYIGQISIKNVISDQGDIGNNTPDFDTYTYNQIVIDDSGDNVIASSDLNIVKKDGYYEVKSASAVIKEHYLLIKNTTADMATIKIMNLMDDGNDTLKVYRKCEDGAAKINVQGVSVMNGSVLVKESKFENFDLGNSNSIESTNEDIYVANIYVESKKDDSIFTDMETTFSKLRNN